MSVKVTWTVKCDLCGKEIETIEDCDFYQDTSAYPPDGWDIYFSVPEEYREYPVLNVCDACPECQVNPDWSKYKE